MRILKDVEMKEYSHMKVGGTAKELIFIENRNEFKEVLSIINQSICSIS